MSDHHDDKIPYEPTADPAFVTDDGFEVYVYEAEGVVPDVIIWRVEGDERADLWGFVGHQGLLVHTVRTIHRHPPAYAVPNCEKWSVQSDDGFPPLADAPETPDRVREIAMRVSDAPVADKAHAQGDNDA